MKICTVKSSRKWIAMLGLAALLGQSVAFAQNYYLDCVKFRDWDLYQSGKIFIQTRNCGYIPSAQGEIVVYDDVTRTVRWVENKNSQPCDVVRIGEIR